MGRIVRYGALAVGALGLAALLLSRKSLQPEEASRRAAPKAASRLLPESRTILKAEPIRRLEAGAPVETILPVLPVLPPVGTTPADVLTGSYEVSGPTAGAPEVLEELKLTASQRAMVDALLEGRDRCLTEIREAVGARRPSADEADRLCARAQEAHSSCLASIRASLLPDQVERFDGLVKSGRWGGYTLVIPR